MTEHEVAIIGGGIVGAATAYYLSKHNIRSIIVEPEEIAAKASGLSYGGIVEVSGFAVPGAMWELGRYAADLHTSLCNELGNESGIDCKYRDKDTLNVAFSHEESAQLGKRSEWINKFTAVQAEYIEPSQALDLEPRLNSKLIGALLLQGTREVDSKCLTTALAQSSGCDTLHKRAISLVVSTKGIRVNLDDGTTLNAPILVCANGTWVEPLIQSMDVNLPVPPLKGEILRLKTEGPPLFQSIGWNGNYCTTKTDGLLWAGTTESNSGYDEMPTSSGRAEILRNLAFVLPGLNSKEVARQTACLRPTTPDGLPYIGPIPEHANVFVGTGAGRKGILYGPAIGKVIADLIASNNPEVDMGPFAVEQANRGPATNLADR